MAQISKLMLKNYKSFRNLEFELKPLNILIGRNGAGKSNLLSFFRLLSNAANGRLADSVRTTGGLSELRWRGGNLNDHIDWEIKFENLKQVDHRAIYYNGSLASKASGFGVRLEEISHDPYPGHDDRYKYLRAYDGYIQFLTAKTNRESDEVEDEKLNLSGDYGYGDQELAITQLRDARRYPLLDEIRYLITDWTIFRGFGENALNNIYTSQSLDIVSPLRLDAEGRNLVSVLYELQTRYVDEQDKLEEILGEAFPEFRRLNLPLTASGKAELQWHDRTGWKFSASQMSDGMLRFLGLATLLLLPNPPSLITIDEPEVGLHPELMPLLAGLMKAASSRTQLIVATHSPLLLNAVDVEDVVVVERENGETHLTRPNQDNLRLWLERYTLGNLWTMGKLDH
jgi:predicted ATPase